MPIPLGVSQRAAQQLAADIRQILDHHFYVTDESGKRTFKYPEDFPRDEPIASWWWNSFRATLLTFDTVFGAEMAETTTYWVPRRGIYHTPALVDSAEESVPCRRGGVSSQKSEK